MGTIYCFPPLLLYSYSIVNVDGLAIICCLEISLTKLLLKYNGHHNILLTIKIVKYKCSNEKIYHLEFALVLKFLGLPHKQVIIVGITNNLNLGFSIKT